MATRTTSKASLVVSVLMLPLAWPAPGSADGPRTRAADFIGLWEGVDEDDGSLAQRAITCEEDGTCRVVGAEQFFSLCDDHGGRGVIKGAGAIEDGVLINLSVSSWYDDLAPLQGCTWAADWGLSQGAEQTAGACTTFSSHNARYGCT